MKVMGTPLQALKFAAAMDSDADSAAFVEDWLNGLQEYWELPDGSDYELFCRTTPPEEEGADGRKAHYGEGKQPWDTCKELGWAAQGAAFSILRYLRRTKTPERDLREAKVYHKWLFELAEENSSSKVVLEQLHKELSQAEFERLMS